MTRDRRPSPQSLRLLATLAAQPRTWRHGYELSKATGLKAGTLYPILMRLADRGLLDCRWEDSPLPARPPRHACRLSVRGLTFARAELSEQAYAGAAPLEAGPRA
ncbi:MAG TPA: helix-turn-helix transcriptional regulator [Steroidobacteraceae bacterium]|jgi:DNA-binding PadR family transcriptional regulator|nr:helix-turn-helix transcriptional regulator [Steroidobacteraceae bacterium]